MGLSLLLELPQNRAARIHCRECRRGEFQMERVIGEGQKRETPASFSAPGAHFHWI
jgi:hypothetical protein